MTKTRKCLSNESNHHDLRFRNTLDLMSFMTGFDDSCQENQIDPVIRRSERSEAEPYGFNFTLGLFFNFTHPCTNTRFKLFRCTASLLGRISPFLRQTVNLNFLRAKTTFSGRFSTDWHFFYFELLHCERETGCWRHLRSDSGTLAIACLGLQCVCECVCVYSCLHVHVLSDVHVDVSAFFISY